jgi:hypothetical protein
MEFSQKLSLSLSLSLSANSIDQPSQKPQKSCHPLQNDLCQCKLCKSMKTKPKNKKILEFLSELSQCKFYKQPTQKPQNGKEKN